jgi:hypothetical protein
MVVAQPDLFTVAAITSLVAGRRSQVATRNESVQKKGRQ